MTQVCAVYQCDYVVEGFLEDFPVCALHDARQTRCILELGELPCKGMSHNRPIVYRAGITLAAEHFEPLESRCGMKAFDDPRMLEVSTEPTNLVHPDQNLTAP